MRKKRPDTDKARLKQMTNILDHATKTNPTGERLFPESLTEEITSFIPSYETAIKERLEQITRKIEVNRIRDSHITSLKNKIRAYWSVIQHRVKDGTGEESSMSLYGLTNGKRPNPTDNREWLAISRQVIQADEVAETEGALEVTEPNRETIQEALDRAETAIIEAEDANMMLEAARARLQTKKEEAKDLLIQTELILKMSLRKMPSVKQRQQMRVLGFNYQNAESTREDKEIIDNQI